MMTEQDDEATKIREEEGRERFQVGQRAGKTGSRTKKDIQERNFREGKKVTQDKRLGALGKLLQDKEKNSRCYHELQREKEAIHYGHVKRRGGGKEIPRKAPPVL